MSGSFSLRPWLDRFYLLGGWGAALSIAGIFILMLVQSGSRELGIQVRGADDISAWLCAASAFLGLAHTLRSGDMVRVGLWIDAMSERWQRRTEIVVLLIAIVFCGYALYEVSDFVWQSYQMNELSQGLVIVPIWIPQTSVVVGVLMLFVALIDELACVLRGQIPHYRQAAAERLARGEFGESV